MKNFDTKRKYNLTAFEKGVIFNNYATKSIEWIANTIGRSVETVTKFAALYGLACKCA